VETTSESRRDAQYTAGGFALNSSFYKRPHLRGSGHRIRNGKIDFATTTDVHLCWCAGIGSLIANASHHVARKFFIIYIQFVEYSLFTYIITYKLWLRSAEYNTINFATILCWLSAEIEPLLILKHEPISTKKTTNSCKINVLLNAAFNYIINAIINF